MFVGAIAVLFVVAAAVPASWAAEKGDAKAGQKTYDLLCASCHGSTGQGDGPAAAALTPKPRSLAEAKYMKTLTDDQLFKVIKEGGASVGKSPLMPAWAGQVKDPEIWNLVAYVRGLAKGGK